eukprot:TRINITY_DN8250_c0_g1_i3.p1 TRINITY_DN8250_c0_g1~~TRINITY_DN8250_c0_g1_i3.p1  ORF type:complete len:224 (-),score=53.21 TRINITY_DN8250_c0_g1_i3:54-725(-)
MINQWKSQIITRWNLKILIKKRKIYQKMQKEMEEELAQIQSEAQEKAVMLAVLSQIETSSKSKSMKNLMLSIKDLPLLELELKYAEEQQAQIKIQTSQKKAERSGKDSEFLAIKDTQSEYLFRKVPAEKRSVMSTKEESQEKNHLLNNSLEELQASLNNLEMFCREERKLENRKLHACLLYTSDAADDTPCVDLGGRRIIKKKKKPQKKSERESKEEHKRNRS